MLAGGTWLLWGSASPRQVLWVGWDPLCDTVCGDRLGLEAKGGFWSATEGLLLPSLAAACGAGVRSLVPLTKGFPGHLCCSAQAVLSAPSSRLPLPRATAHLPFCHACRMDLPSNTSRDHLETQQGCRFLSAWKKHPFWGAERTRILKY